MGRILLLIGKSYKLLNYTINNYPLVDSQSSQRLIKMMQKNNPLVDFITILMNEIW